MERGFPKFVCLCTNSITYDIAVIGIRLMAVPTDRYRPHLFCYPLWREDNKVNIDNPILLQELYDARNLQLNVLYLADPVTTQKAIEQTKKQIGPCVCEYVQLSDILKMLKWIFSQLIVQSTPIYQADILEYGFMLALYTNNPRFIEEVKTKIIKISNDWDPNYFVSWYGEVKDWREELFNRLEKRNEILERIQSNMNEGKIAKLHRSHMIY